ncbi:MAG: hypothetical protein ACRDTC_09375 [Pseudonocardiaceae bacterium]
MGQLRANERVCPACRVTVLSRYNTDPLCALCARAARDSAGIVPTWLWDSGPMREALARYAPGGARAADPGPSGCHPGE